MNDPRSELVRWLHEAHTMERAVEEILVEHARDMGDLPEWLERIHQHVQETRRHARGIERCIGHVGGSTSDLKDLAGELMGRMQGLSTAMYGDQQVKNAVAEFVTEHLEIACYESIIAAAEEIGEEEVVRTCRQILREEEAMAEWIRTQLPEVTTHHLRREVAVAANAALDSASSPNGA